MRLAKYNQSKTITFDLVAPDGVDLIINATFAAGDIKIMKDEGAEANTTNLPTDEGTGYSLVLTATEMSAARIRLYIIDQTGTKIWLDISIGIDTYGNASAEHAFDLDTSSVAQTGDSYARLGTPAGASVSADLLVIDNFVDELESRLTAARATNLDELGSTNIPADIDTLLTRLSAARAGYIDNLSAGAVALASALATVDANIDTVLVDTADMQPRIVAIETDTNELQGDWTNGGRLDLILDIIAADTTTDIPALIAALNDISTANVLTEVNAALDAAISELGVAAPTATPTLRTGLMLLYMALRNKTVVQTSGTDALEIYNNAGTKIASKALTDDGSDYTEAEMV